MENENLKTENKETTYWAGSPSQWMNATRYLLCALLFPVVLWMTMMLMVSGGVIWGIGLAGIYLLVIVGYWWGINSIKYEITSERVIVSTGLFKRTINYLELYRVNDMVLEQPFIWRFAGLHNITFITGDASDGNMTLWAIKASKPFQQQLRDFIENSRRRSRQLYETH